MPSSKLNPPATFNFWRPPRTISTRGVQNRFPGVSSTVPGEARVARGCIGCGPAAPPLKRQPRSKGSSTTASRPRNAAMALSGRRRGGRQLAAGTPANVILCMYVAAAAAAAAPGVLGQQSCTRADLLLDDDRAPCRRSTERRETHTEREREPGPARRRRATVSRAMAVSARRALWRTGFGVSRAAASARLRSAPVWRSFCAERQARRRIVPTRPPATARYV